MFIPRRGLIKHLYACTVQLPFLLYFSSLSPYVSFSKKRKSMLLMNLPFLNSKLKESQEKSIYVYVYISEECQASDNQKQDKRLRPKFSMAGMRSCSIERSCVSEGTGESSP